MKQPEAQILFEAERDLIRALEYRLNPSVRSLVKSAQEAISRAIAWEDDESPSGPTDDD